MNTASIKTVIDYLWQDEANDWASESHRKVSEHIFNHLIEMKLACYKSEHSSQSRPRDFMYSESPFDLGTTEDNDYRNLVDHIIEEQ